MKSSRTKSRKKSSRRKSGAYVSKSGKNEIKAKDLEFRLGGQSNLKKYDRIIEDIRHGIAEKSKSDFPEDIDYVIKHLQDPPLEQDADEEAEQATEDKIAKQAMLKKAEADLEGCGDNARSSLSLSRSRMTSILT